jgi:GTP-binding protein EngB required for normal cell division
MTDRSDRAGDATGGAAEPVLNEHQRRHLLASCQYIDRMLSDIDHIVTATENDSPFARYVPDLSPVFKKLLRDYFARLRADILRVLTRHDATPSGQLVSAVHAVRTTLGFVDIAIVELKPEYLKGYGAVPEALVPEINGFVEELRSVVRALDQALAAGEAGDAQQRLAKLEQAGADVSVLARLERIIAEYGLVEFRPALETALNRLEDQRFEVAVFGRVSSGKSSLLNHLLDRPVLPVGVTPITAIPTRVVHGQTPDVEVHFADRRTEHVSLDRLPEFVTEQDNPANARHVTRLIVRVPAPRLEDGIVFVDTPGLGSLATSGAAETLAYLPRCDLAVVLIDAASTLTHEDLRTLQQLQQAAIPAMVVLSKADLLAGQDRERAIAYTADHLSSELGAPVGVHAVSTMPGHEALLEAWISGQLRPLLARHRELARRSVQRKIGALRASVEASLRSRIRRGSDAEHPEAARTADAEQALRGASGTFEDVRSAINVLADVRRDEIHAALRRVACDVTDRLLDAPEAPPAIALVLNALNNVAGERADRLTRLLTSLAEHVRQALARTASTLSLPEPASGDEWNAVVRELPQIDAGYLVLDLRLPLLGLFGRRMAAARMYQALLKQAGSQIGGALETHARLLRSWGLRALDRLRQQFDAQAQVYRAHLAGSSGAATSDEGAERALRDLADAGPAPPEAER